MIMKARTYQPIGYCIYCNATGGKLSKEHIIPLGLNGNLILPEASCDDCSKVTSRFERTCLRDMMGPLRLRLKLKTRHKKDRPKELPVLFIDKDGNEEIIDVPVDKLPLLCLGARLPPPGIMVGDSPSEDRGGEIICRFSDDIESITKKKKVHLGKLDFLSFRKMLAKIAHGYAIANADVNFEPFLPDLILGKANTETYLVGGSHFESKPEPILHNIQIGHCLINDVLHLYVVIQLFAFMGMPAYNIIVGKVLTN